MELRSLCREMGFSNGIIDQSANGSLVSNGWYINCDTEQLNNCRKSVCVDSFSVNIQCFTKMEAQLIRGVLPQEGIVLYNGGLVCDESWDMQV